MMQMLRRSRKTSEGRTLKRLPGTVLALTGLLIAGLGVRLWLLDVMLYDMDEGVASIYALQLAYRGDFPLVGVKTSLGFYNPPLFIYLIAPAFVVSKSPLVATAWLQGIFMAAITWLAILLYRRGWRLGLMVMLIFVCLQPGPLLLCLRLWGHALIPAFSTMALCCLLNLLDRPKGKAASLVLPLVICAAQQIHFSGALLLANCMIAAWLLRIRFHWRAVAAGSVCAAITYVPWLVHDAKLGFPDVVLIWKTISGAASTIPEHSALTNAALFSFSDLGTATAFHDRYSAFEKTVWGFRIAKVLLTIFGVLVLGSTLAILMVGYRRKARTVSDELLRPDIRLLVLGLIWIMVPLGVFGLLRIVTVPAYWLPAFPGPWLLAGALVEFLFAGWAVSKTARNVILGIVAVFGAAIAAVFAIYLVQYKRALLKPDADMQAYPAYRDLSHAVSFVSRDSQGTDAVLVQAGAPAGNGIGFEMLYLLSITEGNGTRLRPESADIERRQKYVVRNRASNTPIPGPPVEAYDFGLLSVFKAPPVRP
jgi:hypothetical protein